MTAAGHPRSIFKRAIENGNLPVAEVTARELGRITLVEALELTALAVGQKRFLWQRRPYFTTGGERPPCAAAFPISRCVAPALAAAATRESCRAGEKTRSVGLLPT